MSEIQILTAKQRVQAVYPTAEVHAHGRELWIFSCDYETYKASGYDTNKRTVLSKTFLYEGPWEDVAEPAVFDEMCLPLWADALSRL